MANPTGNISLRSARYCSALIGNANARSKVLAMLTFSARENETLCVCSLAWRVTSISFTVGGGAGGGDYCASLGGCATVFLQPLFPPAMLFEEGDHRLMVFSFCPVQRRSTVSVHRVHFRTVHNQ